MGRTSESPRRVTWGALALVGIVLAVAGFFLAAPLVKDIFKDVGGGGADCGLEPLAASLITLRIGPLPPMLSCVRRVRVNGLEYAVGFGRWLDEDALELHEYGPITHANSAVVEPIAYALDGVDPEAFLITRHDGVDDLGPTGPFMALSRNLGPLPPEVCRYADPDDPQFPVECPKVAP